MRDTVKKDNRKSLPLFLLTVALAGLVGGVCGFFGAMAADKGMLDAVWGALEQGLRWIAPWSIPVSALGLLFPAWLVLRAARRRFAAWDGESEEESEAIEGQLNQVLLLASVAMLLTFFFLAASPLCARPLVNAGCFLVALAAIVVLEQKVVDLTRRMNPEKQGSVYDPKFQKKWLESCDEAQRAQIGQASFAAFRAGSNACAVVWLVLTLLHLTAGTGLLPVAAVLVVWGVLQVSYMRRCMAMSRAQH